MKTIFTLLTLTGLMLCGMAFGQCDSTAALGAKFIDGNYVLDGQSYRALLIDDQIAEFETTFYADAEYRISAFAGMKEGELLFSVIDQADNVLFTNQDYQNSPYWDFEFEANMKCRIEARLSNPKQNSGCAVLHIGFAR